MSSVGREAECEGGRSEYVRVRAVRTRGTRFMLQRLPQLWPHSLALTSSIWGLACGCARHTLGHPVPHYYLWMSP